LAQPLAKTNNFFFFPPQGHFIGAMARVAEKLANEDNVIGFDSLNEPNLGMTGLFCPYSRSLLTLFWLVKTMW